ncbi:MAG: hypothetical protein NTX55_01915 [Candidatus Parcubacteria bacterium]|nr:hypothetical protein [Candidatus Parcubacteria bacterium]
MSQEELPEGNKEAPTESSEQELSPEILKKIMEKVIDINAYGTAFSVVDKYNLEQYEEWKQNALQNKETFEEFEKKYIKRFDGSVHTLNPQYIRNYYEEYLRMLEEYEQTKDVDIEHAEARWKQQVNPLLNLRPEHDRVGFEEFFQRYSQAYQLQQAEFRTEAKQKYKEYLNECLKKSEEYIRNLRESLSKKLRLILKDGILGGTPTGSNKTTSKEDWVKAVRKDKQGRNVFFNIVGRFREGETGVGRVRARQPVSEMAKTMYFTDYAGNLGEPDDVIAFMFDNSRMEETFKDQKPVSGKRAYRKGDREKDSFYATDVWDNPYSEYGFAGPSRIPPRLFKGIVFAVTDKRKNEYGSVAEKVYSVDEKKWEKYANNIVNIMLETYRGQPEKLIPIYDIRGNLWWPNKIPYVKVRKTVLGK